MSEIMNNYKQMVRDCKLTTMEVWDKEDEIRDVLYDKGYDLINFVNAPCQYGWFNSIECYSKYAQKLTEQIQKHGFDVILRKNHERRHISYIIFPYNLTHEVREVVDDFEVF